MKQQITSSVIRRRGADKKAMTREALDYPA
jgi:hypothetical protein